LDVRFVFIGDIFFGEDSVDRTFGHASATIDAGVGIDVIQWPFFRGARDDAFHRADIDTCAIRKTD